MDQIIGIANALLQGGPHAINVLLTVFFVMLLSERRRLEKIIEAKDKQLAEIVDEYHEGNITLADAMNSLKIVLAEIKGGLK